MILVNAASTLTEGQLDFIICLVFACGLALGMGICMTDYAWRPDLRPQPRKKGEEPSPWQS